MCIIYAFCCWRLTNICHIWSTIAKLNNFCLGYCVNGHTDFYKYACTLQINFFLCLLFIYLFHKQLICATFLCGSLLCSQFK